MSRLASAYEADPDKRADLRQDIHIGLWRSFAGFNGTCSLRTWVYRVAHNVAASHVLRHRRARAPGFVSLDALEGWQHRRESPPHQGVVPMNPTPHSPQELWRSQKEEMAAMTLADIRREALAFQTRIRRRNAREYAGVVFGTILYGVFIWNLPGLLTKIGSALTLLAMYYAVYQIRRDGAAGSFRQTPRRAIATGRRTPVDRKPLMWSSAPTGVSVRGGRMILKHFFEDSLAQSAYLVGCGATREAIVIDPNIDIQTYVDAAEAEGLRITKVTETHIHADFVSGARALAQATGATLYVSGEGGPDWQYTFAGEPGVQVVRNGDVIELGRLRFEVVHTPGHTPEHLMFVITDTPASAEPLGAFTGDFLFVGDVGRPDLLETAAGQTGTMESSAKRLFASLQALSKYSGHLMVWPAHGSGSACGKSMSGVPMSSLGYERISNWALREKDEQTFLASVLADQPDPPMYFGEMKRVNRSGTPSWSATPLPEATAGAVSDLASRRQLAVDVRPDAQRGTLPGAVIVPMGRSFSSWAGSVLSSGEPFFVIAPNRSQAENAARALALIGRTGARGWIAPEALAAYRQGGGELETIESIRDPREGDTLVDVRTSAEWRAGRLKGATHVPLARLPEKLAGLDPSEPVVVYCAAGVRSVVAASALRRHGFSQVTSLEGGLTGYRERNQSSATFG